MKIRVKALLWRSCNQATFDSLHGISKGQYDIRLTTNPGIATFFAGLEETDSTDRGGFTLHVPIERFEGVDPVAAMTLDVHYMGPRSQRKDWNIPAQRPETAYELWRPGRGVPASIAEAAADYVLLVRDVNDRFHARWLRAAHLTALPANVREAIVAQEVGVRFP